MRVSLFLLSVLFFIHTSAQKIHGTVYNDNGDLLPYASVIIKGTSIGASANNQARYSVAITPGTYIVVCQHIGYTRQEKKVVVDKQDEEVTFILSQQKLDLKAVVVRSGGEDPAYSIIRKAINKRPFYNKQVNGFTCDLYTKDIMKLRNLPDKILGQKVPEQDRKEMGVDSSGRGIIYLSESVDRIQLQEPDKFKMEVISSRVSGSGGFGFTFPAFISFYNNNVTIFSERFNPRGFISPISDNAIGFYSYKFLGSFWEDGKEINSIRVTPRRKFEPLFSGIINITENDWRIHSADLIITPTAQLEILDTLQITQIHVPVSKDVWRVKNQLIHFNFRKLGIDAVGNFVNVYSNYTINPVFSKKVFDRVIIKYDTGVNKRPRVYWDSIRPIPLEQEEKRDYQSKDSLYDIQKDSIKSQSSIDSLNRHRGKLRIYDVFWKGLYRTRYSTTSNYTWNIESLVKNMEFNTAEGLVLNVNTGYKRYLRKWKTNFSVQPSFRYGFSNNHFNAWADINFRTRDWSSDKKLKRESWTFSGGKRVSQFNKNNPINPLDNTIGILFFGNNFMKTYENSFGSINFSKRYESGFRFTLNALFEDRKPLDNTTHFTIFKSNVVNITPNYPYERFNEQFTPHKAFILSADISIKPGQRYIEFPNRKVPIGSKYPTFSLNYTKGIESIFGSNVNFDKWRLTINDDRNFKIAGLLKYKVGIGGFFNDNKVFIQDYQHFKGNRTTGANEYVNSFQLAPYYALSTTASFFTFGHVEHHFNGLLTNKIPIFKRLNWNLVAGSNALYVNPGNNYIEFFAGLENIFKIFRIDLGSSFVNGNKGVSGYFIGFGGTIGSNFRPGLGSRNVALSF